MDKLAITIIILIILAAVIFFLWYNTATNNFPTTDPNTKGIILFYGDGCHFCKNVEDFIALNNIKQKVSFVESEVWHNKNNLQLMTEKLQICGITSDSVGIPLLFDGDNKCYIGDVDIINFFKNK